MTKTISFDIKDYAFEIIKAMSIDKTKLYKYLIHTTLIDCAIYSYQKQHSIEELAPNNELWASIKVLIAETLVGIIFNIDDLQERKARTEKYLKKE